MSDYLVPLLILMLLAGIGWALRQRPLPVMWHGHEYRAVLDTLEDAVLMFDQGGWPLYLNRAARVWFGLGDAESYNTHFLARSILRPNLSRRAGLLKDRITCCGGCLPKDRSPGRQPNHAGVI
jgi:PAS domain-containing protein